MNRGTLLYNLISSVSVFQTCTSYFLDTGSLKETRTNCRPLLMVAIRAISHHCVMLEFYLSPQLRPHVCGPRDWEVYQVAPASYNISQGEEPLQDCVERLKGIKLGTAPSGASTLLVLLSLTFSSLHKNYPTSASCELLCIFSSPFLITRVPPEPPASLRSLLPGHRTLCDHGAPFPSPRLPLSDCWLVECSPHLLNLSLGGEI